MSENVIKSGLSAQQSAGASKYDLLKSVNYPHELRRLDMRQLKQLADLWGKLPEKERAKAMMELTRDMPPRYREVIENYFKNIAKNTP